MTDFDKMTKAQLLEKIGQLEKQIHKNIGDTKSANATHSYDLNNVMHELQVHQIELEMQNRELIEAQLQLEETRDNYADLYDFAPVNYVTFNDKGIITNINLTGASMMGDVRTNIIGQPFTRWLHKEDVNTFLNHLNATLNSDIKNTVDLKLINKLQVTSEVMVKSVRSNDLSTNTNLCRSVILDITEHNKRTNKIIFQARQLRLITDALPVLIAYIDINESHLFANKTYTDAFGFYYDEITGKTASEIWGERIYNKIVNYLKLSFSGQTVNFDIELPIGDTGDKYFHMSFIPDYDSDNHIHGCIALIGDITDRLAIEAIDRKRLLDIAHFSRLSTMGEMASEIAHELNQPLAAISIYSDACRRMIVSGKEEQGKIIQSLTDIGNQATRAGDFIRRIREFASKKDIQRINTNINELVDAALKLLAVEIRAHKVKLKLNFAKNMPDILVDKILLEQVIFNLARNALEAMDDIQESSRVLVIQTSINKSREVEVSIDDSGPGIPDSIIKNIFETFYTTKENGMGMGLAISYSIIEAHHGHMWAVPNDHNGTTFSFTLPQQI